MKKRERKNERTFGRPVFPSEFVFSKIVSNISILL